jgi:predicted permease
MDERSSQNDEAPRCPAECDEPAPQSDETGDAGLGANERIVNTESVLAVVRDTRYHWPPRRAIGRSLMEAILRDIGYAARQLRRSPGFALAAIVTMALGIGANTAIFSVVYGLLLESLPFHDAEHIVSLLETHPRTPEAMEATYPDYQDWQSQQKSFEQLAAYSIVNPDTVSLRLNDRAEQVHRVLASGNFFSVLGVSPLIGRTLNPQDDLGGGNHVAVLSSVTWQRYFGADRTIIGRSIELNGSAYTVVGVLPARAGFPATGEIWIPLAFLDQPTQASHVWHSVRVLGRLKAGVSLSAARVEMRTIANRLALASPATNRDESVELSPLRDQLVGPLRPALLCVMGCVVLVLLIACANVANLLLVRAARLQHDTMVREALGASRGRLFAQHLAQTAVICTIGGTLGVVLAFASLPLIRLGLSHAAGIDASVMPSIRLSLPAMGLALAVCALTAVVFGLLPVYNRRLSFGAKISMAGSAHTARQTFSQSMLVIAEIAIAVVVSFLSLLMIRSFQKVLAIDSGYRTDHLLSLEITLPQPRYSDYGPETPQFYQQLLNKIKAAPGVRAASTTTQLPLHPSLVMTRFLIQGAPPVSPGNYPLAQIRFVTPDFFSTMGLGFEAGRTYTQDELNNNASLFIVNHTFAKRYLHDRNPIGAKVTLGVLSAQPTSIPVIGVVADAHEVGIDADAPAEIFLPGFGVHEVLLIRTDSDPRAFIPSIEGMVKQIDPAQPIYNVQSMDEVVSDSLALRRITTLLISAFALLALILATIGIYGVLAYSVAQRTREIGVRMAVGAQREDIVALFLKRVIGFAGIGAFVGLLVAIVFARAMNSLLFRTSAIDSISALETCAVLAATITIAVAIPVRRAASLNPTDALRTE